MYTKLTKHNSLEPFCVVQTLSPNFKSREHHCLPLIITTCIKLFLGTHSEQVYNHYYHQWSKSQLGRIIVSKTKKVKLRQTLKWLGPGQTTKRKNLDSYQRIDILNALHSLIHGLIKHNTCLQYKSKSKAKDKTFSTNWSII